MTSGAPESIKGSCPTSQVRVSRFLRMCDYVRPKALACGWSRANDGPMWAEAAETRPNDGLLQGPQNPVGIAQIVPEPRYCA